VTEDACRVDVWLWRARFFKSRADAQRFVEAGRVRLSRAGQEVRLDKRSRTVRKGDVLVFALGQKLVAVNILGLGERRGSASEARALYEPA
jgi:ribosome-associated heat shock protein Hsp15